MARYNFSNTSQIAGAKELSLKLSAMGEAVGGNALRAAVRAAAGEALKAAKAAAPVGNPPYEVKTGPRKGKLVDPYPKRTYKGRLTTPGFARNSIRAQARLSRDKRTARVNIGVLAEAFYAVQFFEFGARSFSKRPWLEPSFRASIPAMDAKLKAALKQKIDKAARKRLAVSGSA